MSPGAVLPYGMALLLLMFTAGCGPNGDRLAVVSESEPAPDLIIYDVRVKTGNPGRPEATAFAVTAGRFSAVGSSTALLALAGAETELIELGGLMVTPGFIDSHTHLMLGKNLTLGVDLTGLVTQQEWLTRIEERVAGLAPQEWLVGGNWDHNLDKGVLPTKEDLDRVTGAHPAILWDIDHHSAWVNTAALEHAQFSAATPVPPGGAILLNELGEPSGILLESAGFLMEAAMPRDSTARQEEGILGAMALANQLGITMVHDMSAFSTDTALNEVIVNLTARGKSTVRVWEGLLQPDSPKAIARAVRDRDRYRRRIDDSGVESSVGPLFDLGYVKYFMDGVLSTRTAVLNHPYSDAPDTSGGIGFLSVDELSSLTRAANEAGFAVATHAVGDRAVSDVLDAYEAAGTQSTHPNRIEHLEIVAEKDVERFATLGISASMQPYHLGCCGENYVRDRLGDDRLSRTYLWRTLAEYGVAVVLGSDWPTSPFNPLSQIAAVVSRQSKSPGGGLSDWPPLEEALTFDEAVIGYSHSGAAITAWADQVGSIEVGKWADFVVLDGSATQSPDTLLLEARVLSTYLAGRRVYPVADPGL